MQASLNWDHDHGNSRPDPPPAARAAARAAVLDTAWTELVEVGFANLTMESVAARAGTASPCSTAAGPTRMSWCSPRSSTIGTATRSSFLTPARCGRPARPADGVERRPCRFLRHRRGRRLLGAPSRHRPHPGAGPRQGHGGPAAAARPLPLPARPRPRRDRPSSVFPPPCSPCRSTWCATTCCWTSSRSGPNASSQLSTNSACPLSAATTRRLRQGDLICRSAG